LLSSFIEEALKHVNILIQGDTYLVILSARLVH